MPLEGQRIDRYHILRLLGSGGMGDVYLAEDPHIGQQVAIKIMRREPGAYPESSSPMEVTDLFSREIQAIGKLDHPHILPLFDYGQERIGDLSVIYLVMPYRPEGSLAKWLAQREQRTQRALLSLRATTHLIRQAADALQHAHDRRIIHQDVKPSNFLIRERKESPGHPDLLLSDFGIARVMTTTAGLSQTTRGTPTYMAPEQCLGQAVPASDQYALAIMTYELLTGRPPFLGGPMQVMFQQIHDIPRPPGSLNPALSQEVDLVILRALSKQSSQRFDSISAFAAAFEQAVQHLPQPDDAMPAPSSPSRSLLNPPLSGEIRAELAISTAEAQIGTTRIITLPGGQTLSVKVPPGVQDGYIIRLDSLSGPSTSEDTQHMVSLTIRIKQESGAISPSSSFLAQSTELFPGANNSPGAATVPKQDEPPLELADAGTEQSTVIPITPVGMIASHEAPTAGAVSATEQTVTPGGGTAPPEASAGGTVFPEPAPLQAVSQGARVSPDARTEGAIAALPAISAPARKPGSPRWILVALPALVLLLIISGFLVAVAHPFRTSPSGVTNSLATVTITPESKKLANTYRITGITTTPDASLRQVAARLISSQTSPQSQTVPATGTTTIAATHASGTLTLYNYSTTASVTLAAGTDLPNMQAVAVDMILDGSVTVQPATDPTNPPTGTVPAHVAQAGTIGNLPTVTNGSAGFYYCTNCSNGNVTGWEIENDSPFSGGRDAQTVTVVQQRDITGAASAVESSQAPNPQQVLQGQVHPNEQFVGTPQCKPNAGANHQAGDQATTVTVTVSYTCTGEVYDRAGALSLAAKLLGDQAAADLGAAYALVGKVTTMLTQAIITDAARGSITLTIAAQGRWALQFSTAQKQALAVTIVGKTPQQAQTLLLGQPGVQQVTIQLSQGSTALPTDAHQISIVIRAAT